MPRNDGSLYQIAAPATDLDASIRFYRTTLNLELIYRTQGSPELAFFDLHTGRLMLERSDSDSTTFYLWFNDLDEVIANVEKDGHEVIQRPFPIFEDVDGQFGSKGETEWLAFVADPSGNSIGLMTRKSE